MVSGVREARVVSYINRHTEMGDLQGNERHTPCTISLNRIINILSSLKDLGWGDRTRKGTSVHVLVVANTFTSPLLSIKV